jgi:arylsulfatase A-like enzyme
VPAGRVSDAIFATIDFMPTFARLAGYQLPEDRQIDGTDQSDLILGKRDTGREHFYFGQAGVRKGKWKYLKAKAHFHGYAVEDDRMKIEELYDLDTDIGEQNNLAEKHPQKVSELRELMLAIEGTDSLRDADNRR